MTGEGWVGRPLRRVEDRRFITGRGQYVDDVLRPRLLHLAFVRSPHAHARVVRLDASAAQSSPGVVTVLTGRDVPSFRPVSLMPFVPGIKAPTRPVLAGDTVHMVGELVAAVIARDPSEARDAAERVVVGYEPLDALPLAPAALKAPALGSDIPSKRVIAHRWNAGDAETAFRAAAHVERLTIDQNRVSAMTMEPRTVLAEYDPGTDLLTVWISIQSPFPFRAELARMLDFPEERIRVTAPDVGGGFGVKAGVYPEDVIVAYAALTLGRAVKWVSTRGEDFQSTTQGRGGACEAEIALAADGTITGLRARIVVPVGARLVASAAVPPGRYGNMMPGAYRVASVDIETNGVLTTTAPTGAYRGAGRPEAMFAIERLVEQAARSLIEQIVYDGDGQLLTASLMDYAVLRADDTPAVVLDGTTTPSPLNPIGAKGVGEAGAIAAPPAIVNAAVAALAPLGVQGLDMPLSAEKLWRAIHRA